MSIRDDSYLLRGIGGPDDVPPEPSELVESVFGLLEDAGVPEATSDTIVKLIKDWETEPSEDVKLGEAEYVEFLAKGAGAAVGDEFLAAADIEAATPITVGGEITGLHCPDCGWETTDWEAECLVSGDKCPKDCDGDNRLGWRTRHSGE